MKQIRSNVESLDGPRTASVCYRPLRDDVLVYEIDWPLLREDLARAFAFDHAPGDENELMARWHQNNPRLYARIIRVHSVIHMVPSHLLERRQHPCSHEEDFVEHPNWDSVCREALQTLHERERSILQKRYRLYGGKPMNLREIGDEMHLTRERIRQIQTKAEKKLRRRCDRLRMLVEPSATDIAANKII